jgi:hypothetical protein
MANILYRGSATPSAANTAGANNAPLTNDQIDKNFYALNTDKLDKYTTSAQSVASNLTFSGAVTVTGNLIVNGATTTINSNTISVDDKNLELGSVVYTAPTGNITSGSYIITNLSSTSNIIPGSAILTISNNGNVTLPSNTRVVSIDNSTQITLNNALTGSGSATDATININGSNDATADGGGITLKGTTDKTIVWDTANSNWTSSENWNIPTGKTFKINNADVLSGTALGSGVTSSSLTKIGLTTLGFVKSDVSGNLSVDTNTYLTSSSGVTSIKGGAGTAASGAIEFVAGNNVTITQSAKAVTINSSYSNASITNDTASTTSTFYPTMATVATGSLTAVTVSSSKLYYTPSTGTLSSSDFSSLSDIRYKKDLVKISSALNKVKDLSGYTFNLIESNTRSAGVVAQEVQAVLPEAIGGTEERLTVSYGALMGLIVEAIKELNDKVEDIQNQLANK